MRFFWALLATAWLAFAPLAAAGSLTLMGVGQAASSSGGGGGGSSLSQDAVAGTTGTSVTSLTWTHVVNSSANLLVVAIAQNGNAYNGVLCPTGNSITAGGVSMTRATNAISGSTSIPRAAEIWTLSNPPTGSISIVASIANTCNGGSDNVSVVAESISFLNAASSPIGTPSESASSSSGASSLTQTTSSANSRGLVVAVSAWRSTTATTAGSGEATIVHALASTNVEGLVTTQPSSASTTDTHSNASSDQSAMAALPINSN
jgi:hypothetical protein